MKYCKKVENSRLGELADKRKSVYENSFTKMK
ncbi:hypothetical protein T11_15114 [Trichinella zimbabwensis]|uniref:Uncharacterized protein n=2 Tax=Trichinella TaxID=6333 RepID=A0A0V1LZS1_9BILA|nr:hypothetical protein T11_9640 [Trichinella zimbabwensis]KRZ63983.1 hypothetical protein T10_12494 [Trichinella papuae]KRY98872.1 hypothetical protein T11_8572 [Trichinella zimbabwensis]KRY98873.1 hypothetical protein T11_15114 [Trichinella zimbabwensis]KRZ64976.1 hypothetical protein T10_8465 [Trichinella papuae]